MDSQEISISRRIMLVATRCTLIVPLESIKIYAYKYSNASRPISDTRVRDARLHKIIMHEAWQMAACQVLNQSAAITS
jgi:hypothetical protein